ncbi:MAG: 30S ribosomal protein S20 [bacterium]|nr:30S ribosomal protein S20 [bacterium]
MPQIKSAKKRVQVAARQTRENNLHRTRARTAVKRIRTLIAAGKGAEAAGELPTTQKYLDKAGKVRAIHPRAVARHKARLAEALKEAGAKPVTKGAVKNPTKKTAAKKPAKKATTKAPAKKAAAAPKASKKTTKKTS